MASEAQRKANKKYQAKMKRLYIDFSPAEEDLWQHIQHQEKKQTYVKNLIRAAAAKSCAAYVDALIQQKTE